MSTLDLLKPNLTEGTALVLCAVLLCVGIRTVLRARAARIAKERRLVIFRP